MDNRERYWEDEGHLPLDNVIILDDRPIDVEELVEDYLDMLKDCQDDDERRIILMMMFDEISYLSVREFMVGQIQGMAQGLKELIEEEL
jgi:hypothetical protein